MKNRLLMFALILAPLIVDAQPNATIRAFKAEKLFMQGLSLSQDRNFQDAIDIFNQVIELNDKHPKVYEARGEAYYALRDYEKAVSDYLVAAERNPDDAELWNNAGVASAKLGLYRAAAAYFYEAVRINPSFTMAQQNYDNARKHIESSDPALASNWDLYDPLPGNNASSIPRPGNYSPVRPLVGTEPGVTDLNDPRVRPFKPSTDLNLGNLPNSSKGPARSSEQEYRYTESQIEVGLKSDTYITIDQVRVTRNSTLVSFTISSLGDGTFPVKLAPRGSADALYITSRDFKHVFPLRNIKNLPGWPNQPFNLRPGEEQLFIAEFDRIQDDMFYFHILEGKSDKKEAWNFYDVKLKP